MQIAGIGVVFAAGATVTNNTVINPVAGISDTRGQFDIPFADPAGIYFDCVSGDITVTNNNFQSVNPLLVGQVGSSFSQLSLACFSPVLPSDLEDPPSPLDRPGCEH